MKGLMVLLSFILITSTSFAGTSLSAFDQFDKFDEIEKKEFNKFLKKAKSCIEEGDFYCAENALKEARKYISCKKDIKKIDALREKLASARESRRKKNENGGYHRKVEITDIEIDRNSNGGVVCVYYKVDGYSTSNGCHLAYYYDDGAWKFNTTSCGICQYSPYTHNLWCVYGGTLGTPSSLKDALMMVIKRCEVR